MDILHNWFVLYGDAVGIFIFLTALLSDLRPTVMLPIAVSGGIMMIANILINGLI